jgi:hypothetical protein
LISSSHITSSDCQQDIQYVLHSYSDLWLQKYVQCELLYDDYAKTIRSPDKSDQGSSPDFIRNQHFDLNTIHIPSFAATKYCKFYGEILKKTNFLRVKNLSRISLEFYFTCPEYAKVLPTDSFSGSGLGDIEWYRFKIQPNEETVVKIVLDENGYLQRYSTSFDKVDDLVEEREVQNKIGKSQSPLQALYTPPKSISECVTCHFTLFDNLFIQFPISHSLFTEKR